MSVLENWYEALELDIDPVPVSDQVVIGQRIDEKVKFWRDHTNDPKNGSLYDTLREKEKQIRAEMADPVIRSKMAESAREAKYGALDKTLNQTSLKGTKPITRDQLKRIAKMRGLTEAVVEKRAKDLGIEISEEVKTVSLEHYKEIFDEQYNSKPPKYNVFQGNQAQLESTGFDDYYNFLYPNENDRIGLVASDYYKAAEARRAQNSGGRITAERTLNRDVAAAARKAFENEDAKKDYDNYLAYSHKRTEIDEIIKEIADLYGGKCSNSLTSDYIIRLMSIIVDKDRATELFTAICELKGYSYDLSEDDSPAFKNLVTCRCGKVNDTTDDRKVCERCGQELWHTCPACGKESLSTAYYCSCGFDFSNIVRVDRLCDLANKALECFDLEEAKRLLSEAQGLYSRHKDLPALHNRLKTLEDKIGSKVTEIDRQVSAKNYNQAKTLFEALVQSYGQYHNSILQDRINDQLKLAANKLNDAKAKTDEADILQACREAYEICRDLPGLKELAAKYTELPLDALSVNNVAAQNVSVSVVNSKVSLKLVLPDEGETGITVAFRYDKYPVSAVDAEAQVKDFSIGELEREGLLGLERAQKKTYFIAVYLKFSVSGSAYYSPGIFCQLNLEEKVTLTYSLSKKLFSKKLSFTITPDKQINHLPQIDIVYNVGNVPVYAASAKHLITIPSQNISGNLICEIDPPSPFVRNTYIKPFINENSTGSFQLKLASNSSNKVS